MTALWPCQCVQHGFTSIPPALGVLKECKRKKRKCANIDHVTKVTELLAKDCPAIWRQFERNSMSKPAKIPKTQKDFFVAKHSGFSSLHAKAIAIEKCGWRTGVNLLTKRKEGKSIKKSQKHKASAGRSKSLYLVVSWRERQRLWLHFKRWEEMRY